MWLVLFRAKQLVEFLQHFGVGHLCLQGMEHEAAEAAVDEAMYRRPWVERFGDDFSWRTRVELDVPLGVDTCALCTYALGSSCRTTSSAAEATLTCPVRLIARPVVMVDAQRHGAHDALSLHFPGSPAEAHCTVNPDG